MKKAPVLNVWHGVFAVGLAAGLLWWKLRKTK